MARRAERSDFILCPSGEHRLSNFMLWQASYAEFVDMDVLWPILPGRIWTGPLKNTHPQPPLRRNLKAKRGMAMKTRVITRSRPGYCSR
ncbi:MAG: undecaprenyl diphosphate synthase family protein [Ruthenibacterium lactatiformans]